MKPLLPMLLLMCAASASAQKFADLKLEATPEKAKIVAGEPLTIAIRATNSTSSPITAHADVSTGYGFLTVLIAPPGGDFSRYVGWGWGVGAGQPKSEPIEPGKVLRGEVTLFPVVGSWGREDLLPSSTTLDRPGKYRIKCSWANLGFEERIDAPEIEVEVSQPTGEDATVWKAIAGDSGLAEFAAAGGTGAQAAKAAKLVADHPKAICAPHLAFSLGRHHVESRAPDKAEPYLRQAVAAPQGSALRRKALLLLVQAVMRRKDEDGARKLLQDAKAEFEGSADEAVYRRMVRELTTAGADMHASRAHFRNMHAKLPFRVHVVVL